VPVAARQPEELELLLRRRRIRYERRRCLGVRRRGEGAEPGELVEMGEAEVERLPTAHREAGKCAMLAIGQRGVARLDRRDDVVQQIVLERGERGRMDVRVPGRV